MTNHPQRRSLAAWLNMMATGDFTALLFFRARVGSEALRGVHVIRFNDAGEIEDVEKMVRPARAAVHLGDAIGERSGKAIKALREAGSE